MDVSFFPEERPAAGVSSAKIELHSSMQLSQINTPGPAIRRRTWLCGFPQKEQQSSFSSVVLAKTNHLPVFIFFR